MKSSRKGNMVFKSFRFWRLANSVGHLHKCKHSGTYIYTYNILGCEYTNMSLFICMYTHIHMYVCVYAYIYIYMCTYRCVDLYMRTLTPSLYRPSLKTQPGVGVEAPENHSFDNRRESSGLKDRTAAQPAPASCRAYTWCFVALSGSACKA